MRKSCSAVRSRTSSSTKTEFWRENCPCQFKHWKYPSYEANISICCSICSILNLIQRTASLEQRLLNYLWPCDLRAVVNVGDCFDRSNCMEGALGSRPSTTFRTLKIPKLRGQYFDMLLNMLYFKTYLTDSIARLKVLKLPLAIKSSAVRSRTSFWTKREFWRENCPCQFKHWKYPSYEANISICCSICSILKLIQRTASTEQKDVNYLWPCHLRAVVNVGDCHAGSNCMEGALAGKLSMTFQTW